MSGTGNSQEKMYIKCPHCQMEFRLDDLLSTLDQGSFKCHVCGQKFPSPLPEHRYIAPHAPAGKFRTPVLIILGIVIAVIAVHFLVSGTKSSSAPVKTPVSKAPPIPEKLQTVMRIASEFHKNHTYTMEGEFVCVDMAISVWNQLMTNGIEAKIMGGNVKEDITDWDYRQLVTKSDHAWVVAQISPTEKVAIETTAGTVIKPDMKNAAPYFRGIVFDNPAQIKKFEFIKRKANEVCQEAKQLINDWNNNVAGKPYRSDSNIPTRQSRIEQRKLDCENAVIKMEEFQSRAIFN